MTKMVPAEIALATPTEMKEAARWPRRGADSRLEPVALPILFPKFSISPRDRVFTIGSCFARNIEEYLSILGFDVPALRFTAPANEASGRPNGILNKYTPASMLQEIDRTIRLDAASSEKERQRILAECLLDAGGGAVLDMELATSERVSLQRALERRQQVHQLFRELHASDIVIITFGLIESWWDAHAKLYIQRVPAPRLVKKYPGRFFYKRMDFEETIDCARQIVSRISGMGSPKRILVTASPVPMARTFSGQDVLVANMYSKSLLRSVCEIIKDENEHVDYYPSFEMVVMSKSADIWADDLVHVTDRFVGRVVKRMIDAYYREGAVGAIQQAWSTIFTRDFKAALELLQDEPAGATADLLRGLARLGLGEKQKGLSLVKENCLPAGLDNNQAAYVVERLYAAADFETALRFLGDFLQRPHTEDQHTAAMYARMAQIMAERGDRSGALSVGRSALLSRDSIEIRSMVGEAFFRLGEDKLAREQLENVAGITTKMPARIVTRGEANARLAMIEDRAGRRRAAQAALERARQDAPQSQVTKAAEFALAAAAGESRLMLFGRRLLRR